MIPLSLAVRKAYCHAFTVGGERSTVDLQHGWPQRFFAATLTSIFPASFLLRPNGIRNLIMTSAIGQAWFFAACNAKETEQNDCCPGPHLKTPSRSGSFVITSSERRRRAEVAWLLAFRACAC